MLSSTEHKGKTIHLLKASAKPVTCNRKRKRFEAFDPTKQQAQMIMPVGKADEQMIEEPVNTGNLGSSTPNLQQTRRQAAQAKEAKPGQK